MKEHDYFGYNSGKGIIPEEDFRISPSQVSRYFSETTNWFREFLLGEEGFVGNTASNLGNCVHAGAEMYVREGVVHHNLITDFITNLPEDIDKQRILTNYPIMLDTLISEYLRYNVPSQTELFLTHKLVEGVWVAGSVDAIRGSRIVDYKTTSALTAPTKISRPYWFQQCLYVWLARKNGYSIDSFSLVFITAPQVGRISEKTGKPLKDYPSKVTVLTHLVTDLDMEIIDNTVKLIAGSVNVWKSNPELHYILAQDYRLKLPDKPVKFIRRAKCKD
jgi:hypothetical protein